jgi:hypothetical protein
VVGDPDRRAWIGGHLADRSSCLAMISFCTSLVPS